VLMVWIAVLLAAFLSLLSLRQTPRFATAALVVALGFTITLDALNPDAFIVWQNLQRYERGEELDVGYLGSLSADAVPQLMPLMSLYGPEIREAAGPWLRRHLVRLDERQAEGGWPSYHVGYSRAYRVLNANRELVEQYDEATATYFTYRATPEPR
jgi:hypothetical protein